MDSSSDDSFCSIGVGGWPYSDDVSGTSVSGRHVTILEVPSSEAKATFQRTPLAVSSTTPSTPLSSVAVARFWSRTRGDRYQYSNLDFQKPSSPGAPLRASRPVGIR